MATHYHAYYENQIGGGRVGNIFVGAPYQKGHGIGSFLGGLFRRVLPLLAKGARAIGREALRAGANVMEDMTEGNTPFKESLKRRAGESGKNLRKKAVEKIDQLMKGSGYNNGIKKRSIQSLIGPVSMRTSGRKRSARAKSKKKRGSKKSHKRKGSTVTRGRVTKRRKNKRKKRRTNSDIFGSA